MELFYGLSWELIWKMNSDYPVFLILKFFIFIFAIISRDALWSDLQKMSQHATASEKTSIEDKRRKIEERLDQFNKKAEELIGEDAEDDLEIMPQFTGWEDNDNEDYANEGNCADVWEEVDEEENSEKPEMAPICLPSCLKQTDVQRLGLEVLASQELELRKGQANDCLQGLRLALGHKAVLYRTKVRMAKSSVDKTRAWDDIKVANLKVNKHARAYRRARRALEHLGADDTTLAHFQDLQSKHLKISADITEENRVGQRSDTLPWFWRLDGQNTDQHDTWMQECKLYFC